MNSQKWIFPLVVELKGQEVHPPPTLENQLPKLKIELGTFCGRVVEGPMPEWKLEVGVLWKALGLDDFELSLERLFEMYWVKVEVTGCE